MSKQSVTVRIRVLADTRDVIETAAAVRGQSIGEFMTDCAAREAEAVQLERRLVLDDVQFDAFVAALDAPAAPNAKLRRLMKAKSPWGE